MPSNDIADAKAGAREFVIDTGVVAVAQLLLKMRGLITIPLIVKVLGIAQYGVWVQTLALVDFSSSLLGVNLHLPLVRFLAEKPTGGKSIYSTLMTATIATSALGGVFIYLTAGDISRYILSDSSYAWSIRIGGLLVVCYNIRFFNLNVYRALGRLKERSLFELLSTFGQLLGISLLLWRGHSLLGVFIFMAVWETAFAVLLSSHVVSIVGWGVLEKGILLEAFRYALPLLPAGLSVWMLDRVDRLVIGFYLGAKSVGIYSASYAFAGVLMLLQTPLQITLLPKVASLWESDLASAVRYINFSNKLFLTFAIPFVIGVPIIAPRILSRLGNDEIGAASGVLTFLIAAGVMLWGVSLMLTQVFYGARRTLPVGIVTVAGAVLNFLLNLLLVPRWGINAAAFATLVSYFATCVILYLLSCHIVRLKFYWFHLLKCIGAALLTGVVLRVIASVWPDALAVGIIAGSVTYFVMLALFGVATRSEMELMKGLFRRPSVPEG